MIESMSLANCHPICNYHMVSKMEGEDKITLHSFGYMGRGSWQDSMTNNLSEKANERLLEVIEIASLYNIL